MKKSLKAIVIFILIVSVISLSACSDENNDEASNKVNVDQEENDQKNPDKVEENDNKGVRSNPIDLGEAVEWKVTFYADIDDWDGLEGLAKVKLNKLYEKEEAVNMILFGKEASEKVEEGYEFAVADMNVELLEGDEDIPYKTSFDIASVSEDGRKSPYEFAMLSDKYEDNTYTELYPGGSVNIKKAFLVPTEGDFLVEIEENISGKKFFKHK